jgi:hypothetical protein
MRVRSVLITAVAGVAFVGVSLGAGAAHATPPTCCNGGIEKAPKQPTTTTTIKKIDGFQNTPTTVKPKPGFEGPDKLSDTPKDPIVDPAPPADPKDGPDDIAPAPKDNGIDPGEYGNGSGSEPDGGKGVELGGGSSDKGGSSVDTNGTPEVVPASQTSDADDSTESAARHDADESSNFPAFFMIFGALLTAGLIGLLVARMRREDEDAESA